MAWPTLQFLGKQIEQLPEATPLARAEIAAIRERVNANEVRVQEVVLLIGEPREDVTARFGEIEVPLPAIDIRSAAVDARVAAVDTCFSALGSSIEVLTTVDARVEALHAAMISGFQGLRVLIEGRVGGAPPN